MPLWHWVHSSFYACFAIKCDEVPYQPSKSTTCDLQPQGASSAFTGFKTFRFKDLSSAGLPWITINRASAHQCLTLSRRALVNCRAVYPELTESGALPSCSPIKREHKQYKVVPVCFFSLLFWSIRCTGCHIATSSPPTTLSMKKQNQNELDNPQFSCRLCD